MLDAIRLVFMFPDIRFLFMFSNILAVTLDI